MAVYKSEFSLGNGSLKEVSAFQYDDSGAGKLSASVLLNLGAGFELAAQSFTDVALGTGSYTSFNDVLPTKSYVLEQIAGVTPGIPGDATFVDFVVASSAGYTSGQVVAIAASGEPVAADSSSASNSNAIGVVIAKPNATTVRVQVDGQAALSTNLSAFSAGDLLWVATTAGAVTSYAAIPSGEYAVQVGIVSDVANDKIVLQPRVFGQVA